jgi:hypothetical protein
LQQLYSSVCNKFVAYVVVSEAHVLSAFLFLPRTTYHLL